MPTEVPEDRDQNVEACKPMRDKYWSELDDSGKIERMRSVIKDQKREIQRLLASVDALLKHRHDAQTGKMTLPFPEYIGDPFSEWIPRRAVVEAATQAIKKDDVYF